MVSATDYGGFAHDVGNALVGKQRQGSFDVVKPAHSFVVIGQQGIGQAQGCAETAMAIHGVWADPDDCPVQGHDGFMYITEATRFNGSPLGEIFEVKVENYVLEAGPVRQIERRPIIKVAGEIRCDCANFQHKALIVRC